MAVRRIIRMGHPTLRQVSRSLTTQEIASDEVADLVEDMIETLHDYGGVGLAAPQVNVPIRLAVIEIDGGPSRYGELPQMPLEVFINPLIHVLDPQTAGFWEGCLSVPGLRGYVERPQHVRVDYTTLQNESRSIELNGFLATVFQHEFDHLDGKLYIDRITDMAKLSFDAELARFGE
ncbi:MAG: peptide deformylase [Proteobacteria bacterium]|nr:peptide deformylase [Pseudomonadota bacterium]